MDALLLTLEQAHTEVADRLTALFDPKPHWPGPLAATPPVDAASSVDQAPGS